MPHKAFKNTFSQGMQKDLDKSIQPQTSYLDASNLRLVSDQGQSSFSLESIKGNDLYGTLSTVLGSTDYKIVGHCNIRDVLVLFVYNSSNDYIIKSTTDVNYNPTFTIMYTGDFGFTATSPIKAVGRYESSSTQKVYWVDGSNPLRVALLRDSNLNVTEDDYFDLARDVNFSIPVLTEINTGQLTTGMVQYAYQLIDSFIGRETVFSPASPLIHLTKSSEGIKQLKYKGAEIDENAGKAVTITISNLDTSYDTVRVISIHYASFNATPSINIVSEQPYSNSITVTDTGVGYIGSYSFDEYSILGTSDFIASNIATKNNVLFASNITQTYLDLDEVAGFIWDARSYRFNSAATPVSELYDSANNLEYTISSATSNWPDTTTYLELDCINKFNDIDNDSLAGTGQLGLLHDYMFQSNGLTIGGEGPNIKYKILCNPFELCSDGTTVGTGQGNSSTQYIVDDNETYTSKYYTGYASPWSERIKGYYRDEVYRFGIQFFDKKGRPYFVKWIGDIRMPRASNVTSFITYYQNENSDGSSATARTDFEQFFRRTFNYDAGGSTKKIMGNTLSIEFIVDNLDTINDYISGFRIVRMERTSLDRSILAQGIMTTGVKYDGNDHIVASMRSINCNEYRNIAYSDSYMGQLTSAVLDRNVVLLNSPEISFNRNLTFADNDFLEYVGSVYFNESYLDVNGSGDGDLLERTGIELEGNAVNIASSIETVYSTQIAEVAEWDYLAAYQEQAPQLNVVIPTTTRAYTHYAREATASTVYSGQHAGTAAVIGAASFNPSVVPLTTNQLMMVNYKRKPSNQYGGSSYENRKYNTYIPASGLISADSSSKTVNCFGGDTYISMFENMHRMHDAGGRPDTYFYTIDWLFLSNAEVLYYPVETSINCDLRHDNSFYKSPYSVTVRKKLQESAAKGSIDFDGSRTKYGETSGENTYPVDATDLYLYNTVYSQEDNAIVFTDVGNTSTSALSNDTRVKYSDKKTNGEAIDSWLKFRTANYLDVDNQHGSLTNLKTFKNRLYFWQDNAFGLLSVEERSLISDASNASLVLGTGSILERYDYLSTSIGVSNNSNIITSDYNLYWFDNNTNILYKHDTNSNSVIPISKVAGMQSFIKENVEVGAKLVGVFDDRYNDIILTFKNSSSYYTISYNELIDKFISNYSFEAEDYIKTNNGKILEINYNSSNSRDELWIHGAEGYYHNNGGVTGYGVIYNAYVDSEITFIANGEFDIAKIFDSIEWYSNSKNTTDYSIYSDTFKYLEVYNDNQYTGKIELTLGTNLYKVGGAFITAIPRNIVDINATSNLNIFDPTNQDATKSYKERIRDKYATLKLTYDNTAGNKLNTSYFITKYRLTGH